MGKRSQNVPIDSKQNVPVALLAPLKPRYIRAETIADLACEKFKKSNEGITFRDLTQRGLTKRRVQRKLKDLCEYGRDSRKKVLFAPEKRRPQQYYPLSLRAEVMEHLAKRENVLINPTGATTNPGHPLSNTLRYRRAQSSPYFF